MIEKELIVFINKNELTPNQAFFLWSLYNNNNKYINTITKSEKERLYERNLVFGTTEPSLRAEGLALFEDSNMKSLFDEFWELYPNKTPNGRVLKTAAFKTKSYNDAWIAYNRYVKKKTNHDMLMNGLRAELKDKSNRNSMDYMQGVLPWLRARTWEQYADSETVDEGSNYMTI